MRTIKSPNNNIAAAVRLAVIAGLGVATAALAIDLTKLPPPSSQNDVTYAKDIQPIFKAACFECHGAQRPKNNLRLDSLEAALKGGRNGAVIVAGKSEKSELVIYTCWEAGPEHPMPPKAPARRGSPPATNSPGTGNQPPATPATKELKPEQISLIRAWIDQGAK
jgi:mono/diheme cytochrome c family protein